MTDQQAQHAVRPWRAIGVFPAITVCFSGVFWALINITETTYSFYVIGLMWTPGLAAMLTCRILGRPVSTLGWTCNARYSLIGYLIPIAYCLAASLGVWILGFGGFPNIEFVRIPDPRAGEGPAVHRGCAGVRTHLGGLALPDHGRGVPRRRAARVVLAAQAWLRLKTGSLWPAVFLHAGHNLWMQSIFTPLTNDNEYTKWVAGDLGLAFAVVAAVVALIFWLKRRELADTPASGRVTTS